MTTDNKSRTAKYGYVIITTPGLIEDGSRPLTAHQLANEYNADGITQGHHNPDEGQSDVAVWRTRAEAEAVMHAITPEGSSPAVFAGLSVADTYDAAPTDLAYGFVVGQDGFRVPKADF